MHMHGICTVHAGHMGNLHGTRHRHMHMRMHMHMPIHMHMYMCM